MMAGVDQMIEYLLNLRFTEGDLEYLASTRAFDQHFLDYLRNFRLACDIWAIPEGTPIFSNEPIVRCAADRASPVDRDMLLTTINHQSLIATKTSRIVRAAKGRPILEFGSRRPWAVMRPCWARAQPISPVRQAPRARWLASSSASRWSGRWPTAGCRRSCRI